MSTHRKLYCYVVDNPDRPFSIEFDTRPNSEGDPPYVPTVEELYQLIVKQSGALVRLPPNMITAWNVDPDIDIPIGSPQDMEGRLSAFTELSLIAEPLNNVSTPTSELFSVAPPGGSLHLIIVPPENSHRRVISDPLNLHLCSRSHLVKTVYEMLEDHRVVQVRGTPACGKSTLCRLLKNHIREKHVKKVETLQICHFSGWKRNTRKNSWEDRLDVNANGWPGWPQENTRQFLLIDEAQDTYWDDALWNDFIKTVQGEDLRVYIILFCSYGCPSDRPVEPSNSFTPLNIPTAARVSLRPQSTNGIGLLLTREEYDEVLQKYPKELRFDEELQTAIYEWSAGHVGTVRALVEFILLKEGHRMRSGGFCNIEHLGNVSDAELMKRLRGHLRGLPKTIDIQEMSDVFRRMLGAGYLEVPEGINSDDAAALTRCHYKGWVQSDIGPDALSNRTPPSIRYTFPSPLHRSFISWHLDPVITSLPPDYSLYQLAVDVIARFQSSQVVDVRRRMQGRLDDRPPEARYQNELYRGLKEKFDGAVQISPEFATGKAVCRAGRIDFFIHETKWGIECMRDGVRLGEHASRFGRTGAYGQWIGSKEMIDYIILDFRIVTPKVAHPEIPNLYHVVFNEEHTKVSIINNRLDCLREMAVI